MRRALSFSTGLALLAAPALAQTLTLTCTFKDLPAGAAVSLAAEPLLHQQTLPTPADPQARDAAPPVAPEEPRELSWQVAVPTAGEAPSITHVFTFPAAAGPDPALVRTIALRTTYRVDEAGNGSLPGAGEPHEATFGIVVPAGATSVTRCLRLRAQGAHLIAETAADCTEASFAKARQGEKLHLRLHVPGGQ